MEKDENLSEYEPMADSQSKPADIVITSDSEDPVADKVGTLMGAFEGLKSAIPPKRPEKETAEAPQNDLQNEPEEAEYVPLWGGGGADELTGETNQTQKNDVPPDFADRVREMSTGTIVRGVNDGQVFAFGALYDFRNEIHKERAKAEQARITGKLKTGQNLTPAELDRLVYCQSYLSDYADRENQYKKSLSLSEKDLDTIQKAFALELQMRGITISPLLAALGTVGFKLVNNVSGVMDNQPFNPPPLVP